jgi:alkylation response protein AidB-like acyl-CoA dehydrogenase
VGWAATTLSYILVVEELAKYDASHSITVSAHTTLGLSPILAFGTREQQERFIPPLASGKVLGGFGLTEPGAGLRRRRNADACRARRRRLPDQRLEDLHHPRRRRRDLRGDGRDGPGSGARGISSFIACKPTVDLDVAERIGFGHDETCPSREGVTAGEKEDKMGWRASDTRELSSRTCTCPRSSGSVRRARASSTS